MAGRFGLLPGLGEVGGSKGPCASLRVRLRSSAMGWTRPHCRSSRARSQSQVIIAASCLLCHYPATVPSESFSILNSLFEEVADTSCSVRCSCSTSQHRDRESHPTGHLALTEACHRRSAAYRQREQHVHLRRHCTAGAHARQGHTILGRVVRSDCAPYFVCHT